MYHTGCYFSLFYLFVILLHFFQPHNYRAFSSDPYPEAAYSEAAQPYQPESLAYLRLKVGLPNSTSLSPSPTCA